MHCMDTVVTYSTDEDVHALHGYCGYMHVKTVSTLHAWYINLFPNHSASPPSTLKVCPVTKDAPSLQRKSTTDATSCGDPNRWSAVRPMTSSRRRSDRPGDHQRKTPGGRNGSQCFSGSRVQCSTHRHVPAVSQGPPPASSSAGPDGPHLDDGDLRDCELNGPDNHLGLEADLEWH